MSSSSNNSTLTEIPTSVLTDYFQNQLNGRYVLRVTDIIDLSIPPTPAASDFLNVDEEELERDQDSNKGKSAPKKKEIHKGPRLLCLTLTDGKNSIKAIEYKGIPFLKPDLPVGTRVLIKGPVEVTFKVILLKSENIQILGP